mmetsp:Transcript_10583/g.41345  ORF Transcript_10583/g.41345 Transcript_10583/m.41345 type:complete len:289 (-) Transcript_10583:29-895(-)
MPISPSISDRGTSAATESTTMRSTADDLTRVSTTSSAISPVSGWHTTTSSTSSPRRWEYSGSNACSASMSATVPPSFCISAMACSARVVLPDDSGPYTSTMRPRGMPPPSAMSRVIAPEGKVATLACDASPSFMMDPLPKLASISPSTRSRAFFLASLTAISSGVMAGLASSALDALGSAEALALTAGFLAAALVDDPLVATVFAADCARSLAATEDLGAPAEEEVLKLADPPVRDESSPVPLLAVDATIAAGVRRWIARLATLRPCLASAPLAKPAVREMPVIVATD